jgi:hypothetical protein
MKTADLSIDFDFFSREELIWDWGHGEREDNLFAHFAWQARYASSAFDLYEATDPKKYADFLPFDIIPNLVKKGLKFDDIKKIGVAESHKEAFRFFSRAKAPDYLINIDAHHDIYTDCKTPLHCGNWVSHLHRRWQDNTKWIQIYPKWKALDEEGVEESVQKTGVPIHAYRFNDWNPEPVQVRSIFICRSGAWVPPHMDGYFIDMVRTFADFGHRFVELGKLSRREYPSHAAHAKAVEATNKQWAEFREFAKSQNVRMFP